MARVYRVVPGEAPAEFRTGFKTITDIDFDAAGNLYVLQHSSGATGVALPGSLLRVAPDGTRTTVLGGLTAPTSAVIGPDGAAYVTEFGLSPGVGRVLRVAPPDPVDGGGLVPPAAAGSSSSGPAWPAPEAVAVAAVFGDDGKADDDDPAGGPADVLR